MKNKIFDQHKINKSNRANYVIFQSTNLNNTSQNTYLLTDIKNKYVWIYRVKAMWNRDLKRLINNDPIQDDSFKNYGGLTDHFPIGVILDYPLYVYTTSTKYPDASFDCVSDIKHYHGTNLHRIDLYISGLGRYVIFLKYNDVGKKKLTIKELEPGQSVITVGDIFEGFGIFHGANTE